MKTRRERVGLVYAGLCAVNGALVPAVAKLTTGRGDPLFVAAATMVVAAACATVALLVRRELTQLWQPRTWPLLMVAGALGSAGANLLFYIGASQASAIETVLCLQIEPAYALVFAWLFLGHRPSVRRLTATAVLLLGIALAVGAPGGAAASPGVVWLLATPLCWQVSHLLVLRRLVGTTPLVLTAARYIHGAWILVLAWLFFGNHNEVQLLFDGSFFLPALLLQGIVLSYGGTWVWYQGLIRLDLARTTAIVVPSTPLLSLVATFLILGERPSSQQWLGLSLTAAGVIAFVTSPAAVSAPPGNRDDPH